MAMDGHRTKHPEACSPSKVTTTMREDSFGAVQIVLVVEVMGGRAWSIVSLAAQKVLQPQGSAGRAGEQIAPIQSTARFQEALIKHSLGSSFEFAQHQQ